MRSFLIAFALPLPRPRPAFAGYCPEVAVALIYLLCVFV